MRFKEIEDFKEFQVIDVDMAFNALLGHPWMHKNTTVLYYEEDKATYKW